MSSPARRSSPLKASGSASNPFADRPLAFEPEADEDHGSPLPASPRSPSRSRSPSPSKADEQPPDVVELPSSSAARRELSQADLARDLDKEYAPDGVATYRHLLSSQSLGPTNPLRVIAHCDVDAAYAQFEAKRLGLDNSVPIAVQQWQGLIAINYAARAFGITRHENIQEARKKCPELIMCHVATLKDGDDAPRYHENPSMHNHKVSLEPYRRESQKMIKVFNEQCPDGDVEKASIDEAFIDLTLPVRKVLLERFPHLAVLPADAPLGLDTPLPLAPSLDWTTVDWGIVPRSAEVAAQAASASQEVSASQGEPSRVPVPPSAEEEIQGNGWADMALWIGGELMEQIRKAVEDQLGYTTSAGIAHNKVLSKLCSAFKKPRAQTVLRTSAVAAFLRPMKFQKIRFLGGKLGTTMAEEYGAVTVGDLLYVPLEEMQTKFGEESLWIFNILRGVDFSEVKAKSLVKSMLASKNMRPPISSVAQASAWLKMLCIELIGRLKSAREDSGIDEDGEGGVWPKTLSLTYREVGQQSRTKQVPFPFHRPLTPDGLVLKLATRLCGEVLPPEVKPGAKRIKLNNLGLGFSTLERLEEGQRGIEGFFKPGLPPLVASKRKAPAGPPSSDEEDIQVVERKSTHNSFFVKPSVGGSSSSGPPPSEASTSAASSKTASPLRKKAKATPAVAASPPSWTCPQCRKRLPLLVIDDADEDDRGWITAENDRVRMEHEDWHVALSFQEDSPDKKTVPKADAAGSRKVKKKPDDRAKTKAGGKDTRGGGSGASGGGLGDWLTRK